jgi:hypothetical protein
MPPNSCGVHPWWQKQQHTTDLCLLSASLLLSVLLLLLLLLLSWLLRNRGRIKVFHSHSVVQQFSFCHVHRAKERQVCSDKGSPLTLHR